MGRTRAHAIVSGRVQGVAFRDATWQRARELGLDGYVRNLPDGRVEAVFEGEEDAVEQAVAFVRKGPPLARVDAMELRRLPPTGDLGPFEVRYGPRG